MRPLPVADNRIEERPANAAAEVTGVTLAPDEHRHVFSRHAQLLALDAAHRLVRRAGGGTAFRAVTVHRVNERILDLILGRTAGATAAQRRHSFSAFSTF